MAPAESASATTPTANHITRFILILLRGRDCLGGPNDSAGDPGAWTARHSMAQGARGGATCARSWTEDFDYANLSLMLVSSTCALTGHEDSDARRHRRGRALPP